MSKKRLFIRSDAITDGVWWYCGGPDVKDALRGLVNQIESTLEMAMAGDCELDDLEFDIAEMTDDEVAAIPDV